ncbi:MAG: type II secretion system protein [Candidatus Sungbacteria bacterium]|nr:type II secretion system protein [Candidatus Sungbacteria bacterium]
MCFPITSKGFTLIELTVVIAIILLIAVVSLVSFTGSRNTRNLVNAGQQILSILQLAQSKSLAGEDNTTWGVHLDTAQIVLFKGSSFAGATTTTVYSLPSGIEIANISISGSSSDVVFKKITGEALQSGTFELSAAASPLTVFSITVDASGKVYQTGTAPVPAGTRILDMRHRLFTLGWSIKTATTLTLRFSDPPNPDTVQNITMSSYFDAGKTKFEWSGTSTIGGRPQELRIHTTALTDDGTSLSVDRDCRKNSKKLKITIDTKDIATYEADCQTITVEAFGGTMGEL